MLILIQKYKNCEIYKNKDNAYYKTDDNTKKQSSVTNVPVFYPQNKNTLNLNKMKEKFNLQNYNQYMNF